MKGMLGKVNWIRASGDGGRGNAEPRSNWALGLAGVGNGPREGH